MASSTSRASILFGTSVVAALGYVLVSERVRRKETWKADHKLRQRTLRAANHHVRKAAEASGPLGKWYGHLPVALATSWSFLRRQRTAAAVAVTGGSLGAIVLSRLLDRVMAHREAPPGRGEPGEQSYPSGHALETTAASIVCGYTLVREGVASPLIVLPLSAAALASGLGRFALDRHWATDLVGGYCAGIALGTACAGVYEWRRGR